MSNGTVDNERRQSAVAIASVDGAFWGVELRRQGAGYEVLWAKNSAEAAKNWESFGNECGVPVPPTEGDEETRRRVVLGYDGASVAFYRMSMPSVGGDEMEAMVRMQAETRLPLPGDKMEMVWRKGPASNGQISVAMAAARKDQLTDFVGRIRSLQPNEILLDSEAVVRVWQVLFGANQRTALVLNVLKDSTQACLVEEGRLNNAAVLDVGLTQFAAWTVLDETVIEAERFVQDVWSVIGLFGWSDGESLPIVVLSDGSTGYETVAECLRQSGLNATVSQPVDGLLSGQPKLGRDEVFAFRVALGLSLIALDRRDAGFNIFERVYQPTPAKKKRPLLLSMKATGAAAVLMLAAFLVVGYVLDLRSPAAVSQRMEMVAGDTKVDDLQRRQDVLKQVAQLRPDILEMMTEINASGPRGIVLDSISYKRGSPVTVTGQAQNNDQIYEFQKNLLARKVFAGVEIQSTSTVRTTAAAQAGPQSGPQSGPQAGSQTGGPGDGRADGGGRGGGQIKFTMALNYKNFSKKR